MLPAFAKHIKDKKLFGTDDKLLLAISGGVDSTVLAHLLKGFGANFSLAHCNFKLRGLESDADEQFCKDLAKTLSVRLYTTHFDVGEYCLKHKVSVQMAARTLRYDWFNALLMENKLDFLVTAHHANDNIETLFINLLRGTGIKGLKGIPEKSGKTIRPLLPFSKEDLIRYASEKEIVYRTDKSNEEEKYDRNFLRLKILPALKKVNPGLEKTFLNTIRNFKEEAEIVEGFLTEKLKHVLSRRKDQILLNKSLLKKEKHTRSILHNALEPFGFNDTQLSDMVENINNNGLVGKTFTSPSHELTIDRDYLILAPLTRTDFEQLSIPSIKGFNDQQIINLKKIKSFTLPETNEIILNANRLVFPLTLRKCVRGDKFRPFGMKGFKLLSDFFKDEKLNKFEKENCKLLVNGNGEIIWVIGYRSDDRYRVRGTEKELIKLTVN